MFSTGGRTEIAATHADGRAAVWGMQWNRTAGPFEIRITAVKGQARAGVVSSQLFEHCAGKAGLPVPGRFMARGAATNCYGFR